MRHAWRGALSIGAGVGIAVALTFAPAWAAPPPTNWPQWAQDPQHQGFVNVIGQNLTRVLTASQFEPNAPAELADSGGDLLALTGVRKNVEREALPLGSWGASFSARSSSVGS